MLRIVELIRDSAANATEAECALAGARAMLPELDLRVKPTVVIEA
jgi:hypothetical protein